MKKYYLYIKSHCEYPDYEDEIEANSLHEAAEKFIERMPPLSRGEWTPDALVEFGCLYPEEPLSRKEIEKLWEEETKQLQCEK